MGGEPFLGQVPNFFNQGFEEFSRAHSRKYQIVHNDYSNNIVT